MSARRAHRAGKASELGLINAGWGTTEFEEETPKALAPPDANAPIASYAALQRRERNHLMYGEDGHNEPGLEARFPGPSFARRQGLGAGGHRGPSRRGRPPSVHGE